MLKKNRLHMLLCHYCVCAPKEIKRNVCTKIFIAVLFVVVKKN